MSSLTTKQARDEMYQLFSDAWLLSSTTSTIPIVYDNVRSDVEDGEDPWARVSVRHGTRRQTTLADDTGVKEFTATGVVSVQIFGRIGDGYYDSNVDDIIEVALDAFEGKTTPGGVWFRNTRPNEIGPDGPWNQVNVTTEFEYSQLR